MKSHEELIERHLSTFYIFVYRDIEKKLQQLSDKFSSNKLSKQEDDRKTYYEEISKFVQANQQPQVEKAYKVKARIRKRQFQGDTYVWELKILTLTDVPAREITADIWRKEVAFAERLMITPEIQESIRIIKNKQIEGTSLLLNENRDEKEPPQYMKSLLKQSKTFKFKLGKQVSSLSGVPESVKSGNLDPPVKSPQTSKRDLGKEEMQEKPFLKKPEKVEIKEPAPGDNKQKKPMGLGGGLKLLGKLMDREPSPQNQGKEKESKPAGGGTTMGMKLGLLTKKSTKKTDEDASNKDIPAAKEESRPVNLLQRLNMNTKQKDKAKDEMDKAIKGIRKLCSPRIVARLYGKRKK